MHAAPSPLTKYLTVLRIGLADRFAYRANFLIGTVMRLLPFVTVVLFWGAVMENARPDAFGGWNRNNIVGYFVLVFLARAFSSMPGLSREVGTDIREGGLSKYLLRPIDYATYRLLLRLSHKAVYLVTLAPPFAVFVWIVGDHFPDPPGLVRLAAGTASLLLAFVIGFHFHLLLGMLGFWFLEVTGFLFAVELIEYFLSGQLIPLDLLPAWAQGIAAWLPFQYAAFVPAGILSGKLPEEQFLPLLAAEAAWAGGLWLLCRWVWARGVRRYAAFGG